MTENCLVFKKKIHIKCNIYYQPSHLILDNMRYSRCRTFGL